MNLTDAQKKILVNIAKEQTRDIIHILLHKEHYQDITKSLTDDGYEVTDKEVAAELRGQITQWARVKKNPEEFSKLLDNHEKGYLRHHVFAYFMKHGNTQGLWKKLGIDDEINKLNLN